MPRKNKSKKEVVSDIQLSQDADRRRHLISDVIFPYLDEVGDTISYSKIFLQSFSAIVEGVYEESRKKTTIGHIVEGVSDKIKSIFDLKDPVQKKEYDRYIGLLERLMDISVQDFAYAAELPRYIDGYVMSQKGKESIKTIPIAEILGK